MSIDKEKIQQGVLNEIELRRAAIQRIQSELTAFTILLLRSARLQIRE